MLLRSLVFLALLPTFSLSAADLPDVTTRNLHARGNFQNSQWKFVKEKTGNVGFMGGSITEMNGYRPMVEEALTSKFPETKFTFTRAGISSTCSTTGAMRLERDVLSQGDTDLFLVEFAVNDDQDAVHTREECIRGLEGILHHTRTSNPRADIAVIYFVNPEMLAQIQAGKTPLPIAAHEAVCKHYGVSSVYLAKEVADRIAEKKLDWQTYGGTHPKTPGNALAAAMVMKLLDDDWKNPLPEAQPAEHELPDELLDKGSYVRGRFIDVAKAKIKGGFEVAVPNWSQIKGGKRERFNKLSILAGEKSGAEFELAFTGPTIGAFLLAGPDAGIVEVQVDGGKPLQIDLFHRFSGGLHYPRTVIFATDLPGSASAEHTLKLKMVERKEGKGGNAVRIMEFVGN